MGEDEGEGDGDGSGEEAPGGELRHKTFSSELHDQHRLARVSTTVTDAGDEDEVGDATDVPPPSSTAETPASTSTSTPTTDVPPPSSTAETPASTSTSTPTTDVPPPSSTAETPASTSTSTPTTDVPPPSSTAETPASTSTSTSTTDTHTVVVSPEFAVKDADEDDDGDSVRGAAPLPRAVGVHLPSSVEDEGSGEGSGGSGSGTLKQLLYTGEGAHDIDERGDTINRSGEHVEVELANGEASTGNGDGAVEVEKSDEAAVGTSDGSGSEDASEDVLDETGQPKPAQGVEQSGSGAPSVLPPAESVATVDYRELPETPPSAELNEDQMTIGHEDSGSGSGGSDSEVADAAEAAEEDARREEVVREAEKAAEQQQEAAKEAAKAATEEDAAALREAEDRRAHMEEAHQKEEAQAREDRAKEAEDQAATSAAAAAAKREEEAHKREAAARAAGSGSGSGSGSGYGKAAEPLTLPMTLTPGARGPAGVSPTPQEFVPAPVVNVQCPSLSYVKVRESNPALPGQGNAKRAAFHVARFASLWELHSDDGLFEGQLYAPGRVPLAQPTVHFLTCMDGRVGFASLGAPGGDLGQFVLAVQALELVRGPGPGLLTPTDVRSLLREYLARHVGGFGTSGQRRFSMCADRTTLGRWAAAAGVEDPLRPASAEEVAALLETATDPNHVGDVHLRSMLLHPEEYGVRRSIVETAVLAFYEAKLGHSAEDTALSRVLLLPVLEGYHEEEGLLTVRTTAGSCPAAEALVVPRVEGGENAGSGSSYLVHHPDAAAAVRVLMGAFVHSKGGKQLEGHPLEEVLAAMERLASQGLDATLWRMNRDKPQLDVELTDSM